MGRRDRPLDESTGPLHQFAAALRVLREKAGSPTYTKMARASGRSRTALAEAAGGDHVPTWPTVQAYVLACGGDPDAWLVRWEQLRETPRGRLDLLPAAEIAKDSGYVRVEELVGEPDRAAPPEQPTGEERTVPTQWYRRPVVIAAAAVAVVAVVVGVTTALAASLSASGSSAVAAPTAAPSTGGAAQSLSVAITVQNKVALGAAQLSEDRTPAYLSARRLAFCKPLGCAVPGTDHLSGDVLEASCTAAGDQMTNRDLQDPASAANPGSVSSSLWYGVPTTDGAMGYVSEVYLAPASRGGLGLPTCTG